jgi:hypothetical protein
MSYSRCGSKQSLLDSASQRSQRLSNAEMDQGPKGGQGNHFHSSRRFIQCSDFADASNHFGSPVNVGSGRCATGSVSIPHTHIVDMDRRQRNARRKDIQKKLDKWDTQANGRCVNWQEDILLPTIIQQIPLMGLVKKLVYILRRSNHTYMKSVTSLQPS